MNLKIRFSLATVRRVQVSQQATTKNPGIMAGLLVSCLLLWASQLKAQVNTGSLSGLVVDSSGAAVAGAELTVTSADTGYTRTSKSQSDGAYSLPDLPIGSYGLSATANGFSQVQEKVKIGVGERIRLDVHLTVGAANTTVEVNATGLDLQRDDASIGMLVTSDVIEETPLYLRNWDDLLRVVPGVQISRYTNQSRRNLRRPYRRLQCQRRALSAKQLYPGRN